MSALFERLSKATHPPNDARAFAGARVAAIGPGTARALAEHGIVADIVPERFVAEALVEALADTPVEHALVARAKEARDVIPDALRARGAQVDVLALYQTVAEPLSPTPWRQRERPTTSPSPPPPPCASSSMPRAAPRPVFRDAHRLDRPDHQRDPA